MTAITNRGKKIGTLFAIALTGIGGTTYYATRPLPEPEETAPVTRESLLRDVSTTINEELVEIRKPERLRDECTSLPERFNTIMAGTASLKGEYSPPTEQAPGYGQCQYSMNGKDFWRTWEPGDFNNLLSQRDFLVSVAKEINSEAGLKKFNENTPALLDALQYRP